MYLFILSIVSLYKVLIKILDATHGLIFFKYNNLSVQ